MNSLPNHLTISRFWLTAVMMVCMSVDFPYARLIAGCVFGIAALTDALDGYLARNSYGVTTFGKLMDPLADKVLVCAAFIGFIELGSLHAWMVVLIISREFMVTGLRLLLSRQGIVLAAGPWGKWKTAIQMVALGLLFAGLVHDFLFFNLLHDAGLLPSPGTPFAWCLGLVTSVFTAWTGVVYFWQNRRAVLDDPN